MHFAEDTLIRSEDEDEDEERPFPVEKQRLIRKDTPHYKKHFKITKLPKPEAVVALLQGLNSDGVPKEEEELGGCNNNAEAEDQEEAWDEDGRKNGALSQPSVKVRPGGPGSCLCCSGLPAGGRGAHECWHEAPALQGRRAGGGRAAVHLGLARLSRSCATLPV